MEMYICLVKKVRPAALFVAFLNVQHRKVSSSVVIFKFFVNFTLLYHSVFS